jgi:hypothetical protein
MATAAAEKVSDVTSDERRTALRQPAALMPSITSLRLSPGGGEASLVNISSTGALVRCSTRLLPGTAVTVLFEGGFSPESIKSKVVRCFVADICRPAGLSYHIGLHFNSPIQLEEHPVETRQAEAPVPSPPVAPILENRW